MPNTPIIKLRDYGVSTAVFEWDRDGKKSYSISLQRSYKKKDEKEYTNETINIYPEDLLRYAYLLQKTYGAYNDYIQSMREKAATAQSPAAPVSNQPVIDNDIPF